MPECIEKKKLLKAIEESEPDVMADYGEYYGSEWGISRGKLYEIIANLPTLTPPNEAERAGLYGKYTVYKNKDGSLVTDCFILRPAKDPAAVVALRAYAATTDNAELAADIINWVGAEPNVPLTLEQLRKMDGEPVYDYLGQEWYVIQEYYDHELTMTDGTRFFDDDEIDGVDKRFYRRPPEGEEDT